MHRRLIALGLLLPLAGWAHGPAPAPLGVAGASARADGLVRTNIGLALRRDEVNFHYICPAAWGATDQVPPAGTLTDGTLVVPFGGQVHLGQPDGCGFQAAPLGAGTASALALAGDTAWIATRQGPDSQLWPVTAAGPGTPVVLPGAEVTDLAVDAEGDLWAAVARPQAALVRLHAGELEVQPLDLTGLSYLGLRGEGHFLHATMPDGPHLYARTPAGPAEVLRAFTSAHGPVAFDGGWLAVADGVLYRAVGDGPFVMGDEVRWTCLQGRPDGVFACRDRRLYRVEGTLQAPDLVEVFGLEQLVGVDCPQIEAHALCDGQWLHFGGESGLVRLDAGVDPEPTPPSATEASGCSAGPGASPSAAVLLLCLGACLRRRRPARIAPS